MKRIERIKGAVRGCCVVVWLCCFNAIPVVGFSTQVSFTEVCFASFLRLIESPVLSVEIEMVIAASCIRHSHIPLGIPRKSLSDKGLLVVILKRPGVILGGAQIDLVELRCPFVIKEGETQLAFAVFGAEEEA